MTVPSSSSGTFNSAVFTVCICIVEQGAAPAILQEAQDYDWPLEIDFSKLSKRIQELGAVMTTIFTNKHVLNGSVAWSTFIKTLDTKKTHLSKVKSLLVLDKFTLLLEHKHCR